MSRTMVRSLVACGLALAAAGAVQPERLDAAAKSGGAKYASVWPNTGAATQWAISVSPSGEVSGSYRQSSNATLTPQHGGDGPIRVRFTNTGTMTGTLADGVLSITGTQTSSASSNDSPTYNYSYSHDFTYTATVAPDADGNLQGTANTGETFVWWRR
jgi:hypothetical protein